jgi:hypothetical protein
VSLWLRAISILRFGAIPLSVVMFALGGHTLIRAAQDSLPQDNLYALKRAAEAVQVSFTKDSTKQATLQLELTHKRLKELRQATANHKPEQEAAALNELKNQTQKTFATVPQIAAATALATNDSALLDELVQLNKDQKEVVSAIADKPQTETLALASTALETVKKNTETIAALVATVQEQALVDLDNKVSLTGKAILNPDKSKIVVERTTFTIDQDTVILSPEGDTMTLADLVPLAKVNVVGSKTEQTIVAKVISLVEPVPVVPSVKGAATAKPTTAKTAAPKPAPTPKPDPVEEQTAPDENPNPVHGGFIPEPPAPEYAPEWFWD